MVADGMPVLANPIGTAQFNVLCGDEPSPLHALIVFQAALSKAIKAACNEVQSVWREHQYPTHIFRLPLDD